MNNETSIPSDSLEGTTMLSHYRVAQQTVSEHCLWNAETHPESSDAFRSLDALCRSIPAERIPEETIAPALRASRDAADPVSVFFLVLFSAWPENRSLGLELVRALPRAHQYLGWARALRKIPPVPGNGIELENFWLAAKTVANIPESADYAYALLWLRGLTELFESEGASDALYLTPTRLYLSEKSLLEVLQRGNQFLGRSGLDLSKTLHALIGLKLFDYGYDLAVPRPDTHARTLPVVAVDTRTLDSLWRIVPIAAMRRHAREALIATRHPKYSNEPFELYCNLGCVFRIPNAFTPEVRSRLRRTLSEIACRIRESRLYRSAYLIMDEQPGYRQSHPVIGLFVPIAMLGYLGRDRIEFLHSLEALLDAGAVHRIERFTGGTGAVFASATSFRRANEAVVEKDIVFNDRDHPCECGIVFLNKAPDFEPKDENALRSALRIPHDGWAMPFPEAPDFLGPELGSKLIALAHRHNRPIRDLSRSLILRAVREALEEP